MINLYTLAGVGMSPLEPDELVKYEKALPWQSIELNFKILCILTIIIKSDPIQMGPQFSPEKQKYTDYNGQRVCRILNRIQVCQATLNIP